MVFKKRGNSENLVKNLLEQTQLKEKLGTNKRNPHVTANVGVECSHMGGRRELSTLCHLCSLHVM